MIGSAALPTAVFYLVLLLIEGLGQPVPFSALYLQDGVPAYEVTVDEIPAARGTEPVRGRYLIVAEPQSTEFAGPVTARAEASDLAAHTYLVALRDASLPIVLNLAPLLSRFSGAGGWSNLTVEVPTDPPRSSGEGDASLGSLLHIVRRGGATMIVDPESGISLLVAEE
jgi:hypothetical protein